MAKYPEHLKLPEVDYLPYILQSIISKPENSVVSYRRIAKFQIFLWGTWQSCQLRFPKSNKSLLFFFKTTWTVFCSV